MSDIYSVDPRPDWSVQNRGVRPEFFIDDDGTETCRIRCAGDDLNMAVVHVDAKVKERFAAAYSAWKAGDAGATGLSLEGWGQLPPDALRAYLAADILTVEELAGLTDNVVSKIMGGRQWRDRAQKYLAKAVDRADHAELLARIDALTAEVSELRKGRK